MKKKIVLRFLKHATFWLVLALFLTLFFGFTYYNYTYASAFYFVSSLLPVAVGTTYLFNYYLVPHYLLKRKFWRFGLYTAYTIIISLFLEILIIFFSFIVLANLKYDRLFPLMQDAIALAILLFLIVSVISLVFIIKRVLNNEFAVQQLQQENESLKEVFITVRADRKNQQIPLQDILYVESLSDYIKIHTSEKAITTREKISAISEQLPNYFLRIHRSFIVNSNNIESFNKETIEIKGVELPISRTYKAGTLDYLKKA